MRYETRKKLDRAIRMRRLRIAGTAAAFVALLAGAFLLIDLDAHETKSKVAGTIVDVHTFTGKGAMDGLEVGVRLNDGRHVKVLALKARDPHVGDHIEVTEHRHFTGRTTFTFH